MENLSWIFCRRSETGNHCGVVANYAELRISRRRYWCFHLQQMDYLNLEMVLFLQKGNKLFSECPATRQRLETTPHLAYEKSL